MAAPRVVAALVAVAVAFAAGCSTPAPPPAAPVIEPYRAAVLAEADAFHSATRTLTDAVRAGDVAAAKAAYQPAHRLYVALEPLAEDIDVRIDGRTDTGDARFTGFHRIEKALWADGSLTGMVGYANAMDLDALALRQVVGRASFRPGDVATMANDWLTACMVTMVTGNEQRWPAPTSTTSPPPSARPMPPTRRCGPACGIPASPRRSTPASPPSRPCSTPTGAAPASWTTPR